MRRASDTQYHNLFNCATMSCPYLILSSPKKNVITSRSSIPSVRIAQVKERHNQSCVPPACTCCLHQRQLGFEPLQKEALKRTADKRWLSLHIAVMPRNTRLLPYTKFPHHPCFCQPISKLLVSHVASVAGTAANKLADSTHALSFPLDFLRPESK